MLWFPGCSLSLGTLGVTNQHSPHSARRPFKWVAALLLSCCTWYIGVFGYMWKRTKWCYVQHITFRRLTLHRPGHSCPQKEGERHCRSVCEGQSGSPPAMSEAAWPWWLPLWWPYPQGACISPQRGLSESGSLLTWPPTGEGFYKLLTSASAVEEPRLPVSWLLLWEPRVKNQMPL